MRLLVVLVAAALLVVGCSPGEEPVVSPSPTVEPTPTVVSPSVSVSPSPTVVSESPSAAPTEFQSYPADMPTDDPESAAIIEGWQEYQRVYEKFASDPSGFSDFTETQYVTVDPEASTILDRIQGLREAGLEFIEGRVFRDIRIDARGTNEEGLRTAELKYCHDANHLKVRDVETGEILLRSGTYAETARMVQGHDGKWRVAALSNEAATC